MPNFMPTLLTLSACAVVAMLVLFSGPLAANFSSLCGGFVSSSASFVQTMLVAALRLFGVSAAFLCLYCAFKLPMLFVGTNSFRWACLLVSPGAMSWLDCLV